MSDYLVGRIRATPNITLHEGVEIQPSTASAAWKASRSAPSKPKATRQNPMSNLQTLPIAAAFVFIGADPGCSWLPESMARDSLGYILTGMDALKSGRWPLKDRRAVSLGDDDPRHPRRRRHPHRQHQASRLRRRRRLPGRHLRPQTDGNSELISVMSATRFLEKSVCRGIHGNRRMLRGSRPESDRGTPLQTSLAGAGSGWARPRKMTLFYSFTGRATNVCAIRWARRATAIF